MAKIREIKFENFPYKHIMCSSSAFGQYSPAVFKQEQGWGIRVLIKRNTNYHTGNTHIEYDYFELDKTGLIISSPRGLAKWYNNKMRITDIEAVCNYMAKEVKRG